jgi:hypothetical protein
VKRYLGVSMGKEITEFECLQEHGTSRTVKQSIMTCSDVMLHEKPVDGIFWTLLTSSWKRDRMSVEISRTEVDDPNYPGTSSPSTFLTTQA